MQAGLVLVIVTGAWFTDLLRILYSVMSYFYILLKSIIGKDAKSIVMHACVL